MSENNQRHCNKNRINNGVYLAQSGKYDKLVYIRRIYFGKGAGFHLNTLIVVNMFTVWAHKRKPNMESQNQ
jgi:hypothetical protein